MKKNLFLLMTAIAVAIAFAQRPALPPLPAPQDVPKPGPATDAPYQPLALMPGGVVVTLFPSGSPYLNMARIKEPEVYNMSGAVPGRVSSIVNIHNPSIEFHPVDRGINTGAVDDSGGGRRAQHAERRRREPAISCRSSITTA